MANIYKPEFEPGGKPEGFGSRRARIGYELGAELIGVSRAAVSQYENSHQSPAPDVMRRIATVLNLPLHFFLRELNW